MYTYDRCGRELSDVLTKDVTNLLIKRYELRRLPRERGVSSVDVIYHILFRHWAHDKNVYRDEQQRLYIAIGILMASYFGCRPVPMFDTRIRSQGEQEDIKHINSPTSMQNPQLRDVQNGEAVI
ncbi:MAG: hypothetical protein Q9166_002307 [cf. Caloplaca sp. 2 TL-2023]